MNTKERTLTALRENLEGRLYLYFERESDCDAFLRDAESEGFRFGKTLPTQSPGGDLIAVEKRKQLSYPGFAGHMALQCCSAAGQHLHVVDYAKYKSGSEDFFWRRPETPVTRRHGKNFSWVEIAGRQHRTAAQAIEAALPCCASEAEEEALYDRIMAQFDVLICWA